MPGTLEHYITGISFCSTLLIHMNGAWKIVRGLNSRPLSHESSALTHLFKSIFIVANFWYKTCIFYGNKIHRKKFFLFVLALKLALNVEFLLLLSPETHLRWSDKNLRLRKEIYDFLFADILLCSRKTREREKERERVSEKER